MIQLRHPVTAALLASALSGCEITDACTTSVEPGIVVTIEDAVTGAPLAGGARGAVHEGAYVDSLTPYGGDGAGGIVSRAAAYERSGLYAVAVEHPGYESWEESGVRVRQNGCHVGTVDLTAALEPLPPAAR